MPTWAEASIHKGQSACSASNHVAVITMMKYKKHQELKEKDWNLIAQL